jgi:hypothetical protein
MYSYAVSFHVDNAALVAHFIKNKKNKQHISQVETKEFLQKNKIAVHWMIKEHTIVTRK